MASSQPPKSLQEMGQRLDVVFDNLSAQAAQRFRSDDALAQAASQPVTHPLLSAANVLLAEGLDQRGTSWEDWFYVRTQVRTARQRVYSGAAFANERAHKSRHEIHQRAYLGYVGLINEAIDIHDSFGEHAALESVMSQLAAVAALNRSNTRRSGAMLARDTDANARFDFFNRSNGKHQTARLQLITDALEAAPFEDTITINLDHAFSGNYSIEELASLLWQDTKGTLGGRAGERIFEYGHFLESIIMRGYHRRHGLGVEA